MENNKGQSIFLSIVGVATLLVAIIGATFAYFSITVQGNENASSINVTTAVVGDVVFADGPEINGENIYPNWEMTKRFTISNSTVGATDQIDYVIKLLVTANTLTPVANGKFVHDLIGVTTTNSGTLGSVAVNTPVPLTLADRTAGGESNPTEQIATGQLNGVDSHTYDYHIEFVESGGDQNSAQGKAFSGKLQVEVSGSAGMRTWDNNASTWVTYP